ncbi:MAG: hypothetical protein WD696_05470 [Bryobacteraceae bacterium]
MSFVGQLSGGDQVFLKRAEQIFESAGAASHWGQPEADVTILLTAGGGIHMIAGSDWPLEVLRAENGATSAYRVTRNSGRVRVEGRSSLQSCLLEAEAPSRGIRSLLPARPPYYLTAGGTNLLLPAA